MVNMLENFNDYLSLFVLVLFSISGIYFLFTVSNKSHIHRMKKLENAYYQFIENAEEDDSEDLYVE